MDPFDIERPLADTAKLEPPGLSRVVWIESIFSTLNEAFAMLSEKQRRREVVIFLEGIPACSNNCVAGRLGIKGVVSREGEDRLRGWSHTIEKHLTQFSAAETAGGWSVFVFDGFHIDQPILRIDCGDNASLKDWFVQKFQSSRWLMQKIERRRACCC